MEYTIVGILLASMDFISSFFIADVIRIIKDNDRYDTPQVTRQLCIDFGTLAFLQTVSALIQSYYKFST